MEINKFREFLKENNFSVIEEVHTKERKVEFLLKTDIPNILQVFEYDDKSGYLEFRRMYSTHSGADAFRQMIEDIMIASLMAGQFNSISILDGENVFRLSK